MRKLFVAVLLVIIDVVVLFFIGAAVLNAFAPEKIKKLNTSSEMMLLLRNVPPPGLPREGGPTASSMAKMPEVPPAPPSLPRVSLSGASFEQGDTLMIGIEGIRAGDVQGTLGGKPIEFFSNQNGDTFGIAGIGIKRAAGEYALRIELPDAEAFRENIVVVKRAFPVTELVVSEELKERGYTPENIAQGIVLNENKIVNDAMASLTPRAYFAEAFRYPLPTIEIVGAYGNIRKSGASEIQHLGVDLDAKKGAPVYAAGSGAVRLVRELPNYGRTVIVDHGLGIYSLYLHLDSIAVSEGGEVNRGEHIGTVGTSGYSLAPHLHFSIKIRGESVDPLKFIEATQSLGGR